MGFNFSPSRAGYQFLIILTAEVYSVTLGQMVAALSPTILVAALCTSSHLTHSLHPSGTDRSLAFTVNPFLLVIFSLFCGVTIPKPQLPHFWRGVSGDFFSSAL